MVWSGLVGRGTIFWDLGCEQRMSHCAWEAGWRTRRITSGRDRNNASKGVRTRCRDRAYRNASAADRKELSLRQAVSAGKEARIEEPVSLDQVKEAAQKNGILLQLRSAAVPGLTWFRVVAERERDGQILGVVVGWQVPFTSLLHLDSLRIKPQKEQGGESKSMLGIGLYLGVATFTWAVNNNFSRGELLAIDDDFYTHKRLVKYYERYGFKVERYVGNNGLQDLPDLLVWGGAGTLMSGDMNALHIRWSKAILKQLKK